MRPEGRAAHDIGSVEESSEAFWLDEDEILEMEV